MDASLAKRIERATERTAAVLLGLACAYAASVLLGASSARPQVFAEAAGIGALAYLAAGRALARFTDRSTLPVPIFDVRTIETTPEPELLLTDVYPGPGGTGEEPLVLDDILAELGPDSRVVRLFDRTAMPTPAQLKSRIDAHLSQTGPSPSVPNASQALHDALAELRRSIG